MDSHKQPARDVLELIGNTPLVRLRGPSEATGCTILGKCEFMNPGGSVKDRIALAMVEDAEKSGALKPGGTIIEPTSGNTGIGLAMVAAVKGYKLVLVMPDSMSIERRRLMLAYGATFDLTPREKGMKGAIARAQELVVQTPGAWMPQQFENPANIEVHTRTTAQEIIADFPEGVDVLITGVGTGGHLTGTAKVLKAKWPKLKVYAVEPTASPVISGGAPAPHPIQGIGAGFIPKNLDTALLDGVIQVEADAARLQEELETELALARQFFDVSAIPLEKKSISPLKKNIAPVASTLAWLPAYDSGGGRLESAWQD